VGDDKAFDGMPPLGSREWIELVKKVEGWRSPNTLKPNMDTIEDCRDLASDLFCRICTRFGEAEARRVFAHFLPSPHIAKKILVIGRYYNMSPRPSIYKLANQIAKEEGKNTESVKTYIRRALKELRKYNPNLVRFMAKVQKDREKVRKDQEKR
jgi:hypothetical protein